MTSQRKNFAIVGGGIAGLSAGYYLARAGHHVQLFEAGESLGGLGTFFEFAGKRFERFYHCLLPSDRGLLSLLDDLNLGEKVYWRPTSFAYASNNCLYPLNNGRDVLRFGALSPFDRLRVAWTGLRGSFGSDDFYDAVSAERWLIKHSGRRAFEKFWLPLLRAKFGDRYHEVPALWFSSRLRREKAGGKEVKGYVSGGYGAIIDALARELRKTGAEIHLKADIQRIDIGDKAELVTANGMTCLADAALVSCPPPALKRFWSPATSQHWQEIDYQGVINVVVLLRRRVSEHYWIAAVEDTLPFQGLVETTTLIDPKDSGGRHIVHLMRYVHRSDPVFSQPLEELRESFVDAFLRWQKAVSPEDIEHAVAFRAPFVEPLYSRNYRSLRPPYVLVPEKLFYLSTAQVYPQVTSWNAVVENVQSFVQSQGLGA